MKRKELLSVALISATLLGMTAYATAMPVEIQAKSEPIKQKPEELYKVIAYHAGNDEFVTEDGEAWCYVTDEKYEQNAKVVLTLSDNGTENWHDDIITEVKPASQYYNVPVSHDLQDYIREVCAEYDREIAPVGLELVLAVMEVETNYNASAVGDNCESYGIMQIQPQWHQERMNKLGVTDLMDPYQNVRVGIDYLDELLNKYTLGAALTAYNAGESGAEELYFNQGETMSPYAHKVWDAWRRICLQDVLE